MAKHTIALIFDFDDTLVPDSTTALLKSKGVDADDFWRNRARKLITDGYDPVHAYLKLMLDLTQPGQALSGLTNVELRKFGSTLKPYAGIPKFFEDIRKLAKANAGSSNIDIEFWAISGGLEEIIRGCTKISSYLTGFWGCRLGEDKPAGPVKHIKRAISFTEKTRFVFEINKGLKQQETDTNPLLVNRKIDEGLRKVPFSNMIYIGDGLTDVPCFSLIKSKGGKGFGILHKDNDGNAKQDTFKELLTEQRVLSLHSPKYTPNSDLVALIRTALTTTISDIKLRDEDVQH